VFRASPKEVEGGIAAAAGTRLRERLDAALTPVERVAAAAARREGCAYLGEE
jgi:hypothetical protein